MKEIKLRIGIDSHDFETKLRRAEGFLYNGNKVKLSLQFRGRENEHPELGVERINQARDELSGVSSADGEARHVGRQVTLILSPLPESKRTLKFNQSDESIEDDEVDDSEVEE